MTLEEIMKEVETINNARANLGISPDADVEFYLNSVQYGRAFRSFKDLEAMLTKTFIADIINQVLEADFHESCYSRTFYTYIDLMGEKREVELFIDC